MKNKIAVCIPSYNESHIIRQTLKKIDKGLSKYKKKGYDVVIVNCDNNSQDNTNTIFMNTETICKKESILTSEKGKGINLLNFFNYCNDNDIDYAITLDADVRTIKPDWIDKFLEPLIINTYDYITPIYKRSRYEGSTTNQFAFPIIFATTGYFIRQPIAGDFSFNKKFIKTILKYPTNESVKKYGIDIYMTLISCYNDLKVNQIILDKKIHNPSYNKMEGMFKEVLDSFIFTWNNLKTDKKIKYQKITKDYDCFISSRKFNHKEQAKKMYELYNKKINYNINIEKLWLEKLCKIILNPECINQKEKEDILNIFIVKATKYWLNAEKLSAKSCEDILNKQLKDLINELNKRKENL